MYMFDQGSANTRTVGAARRVGRLRALLLVTTALGVAALSPSRAEEWINPGTGNWLDPANWDLGTLPDGADLSVIGNGGTAEVRDGGAAASENAVIGSVDGNGTLKLTGAGSSLGIGNNLYVGDYSLGTLEVSSGGEVSIGQTAFVGANVGSTGLVTVSGAGSVFDTVFLVVGNSGEGTIEVSDGGTLQSQNSEMGYNGGGKGRVVVDGAGSGWSTGALLVGRSGEATVAITAGGTVSSSYGILGLGARGEVLVDGPGSRWTLGDTLVIGDEGSGTLTIRKGGVVGSGAARIASSMAGGQGAVTVDGAGSRWSVDGTLNLGELGEGTLTISNGGAVDADSVVIGVTGTLTIGAPVASAPVAAGALDTDSIVMGGAGAGLIFNHSSANYTLGADISGGGSIVQMGSGTTTLIGDNSQFDGPIQVMDGELRVGNFNTFASLGGYVTVTGGKLGGTGLIKGASIADGGTLAPGDGGIGTLAFGYLYMAGGSTYEVEITSGSSDLVQVTGIAFLEGADINLKRGMGPLALGSGYTILSADAGIYGSFGDIVSDYAFVTPSLVYYPDCYGTNLATIEFARNGVAFADVATTANQARAAAAIEAQGGGGMYSTIFSLNEAEAQAAFDVLSGEGHATLKGVLMDNAGLVSDALLQRLDAARTLDGSGAASGYAALPKLPEAGGGNAIWGQFYGGLGERAGDGNAASAASSSGGVLLGADAEVGDWQLGVAAQLGQTQVSIADRASEATTADIGAGFYAGTSWGDTSLSLAGTVTQHAISTSREVGFGLNETLTADYGATTGQVVAELEHEFDFGAASLLPYARLGHVVQATDGFQEVGNGAGAALSGEADLVNQSFATLGLRGAYQFVVGQGGLATFSGGIGWRRGFGEAPTAQLGFLGGSPFDIAATPAAVDALELEAGLDLDLAGGLDLRVNYLGQAVAGGQSHALRAGVGGEF